MKRKLIFILIFLVLSSATFRLDALVQFSIYGNWSETIDSSDLTGIVLPSTYTSSSNAVTIDIDANVFEKWLVYVSRSDTMWDPSLQLFLRRTSDGVGKGSISGGTIFQEITAFNQAFFSGQKALNSIAVQFQLTGITLRTPTDSYATTIIYTITDN
jgi:hypothetical protein